MSAITINLDSSLVDELKKTAQSFWITQKKIISKGLKNELKKYKRLQFEKEMDNFAKQIKNDKEQEDLAEWGLDDYLENLRKIEND